MGAQNGKEEQCQDEIATKGQEINDLNDSIEGKDLSEGSTAFAPANSLKVNQVQSSDTEQDIESLAQELVKVLIEDKDEDRVLEIFRKIKNSSICFMQLPTDEEVEVYSTKAEEIDQVPLSALNIVQLAVALDLSDTVIGYFLRDHHVQSYGMNPKLKTLPVSCLLFHHFESTKKRWH